MRLRPTCREVTRLVLEGEERRLGLLERLRVRLHWMVCSACRRFREQTRAMRVALAHWRRERD